MIILTLGIILTSCDCHQNVSGKVLDFDTKQPLDSVYVHKIKRKIGKYTSEKGDFELSATSGGLFGCPPMKIILNKSGYEQKVEVIENSESKIIYLRKIND
ncbi:MAG: carboxypeptidase-like regulatory domain-containing protein [Algicola sp.]|nr:carboxypeptidase-like regulatory domain-containing protein [Algicola sp.]